MMAFRKVRSLSTVGGVCAGLLISISACSDSTGPGMVDANGAVQSLTRGMDAVAAMGTPSDVSLISAALGSVAPLLDLVDVSIDGKSQTMYALGIRESFPAGACDEDIFIIPSMPREPGVCSPPPSGVGVILWQSHSASEPPDRLIFIVADTGVTNFDFMSSLASTSAAVPGVALYMEGQDNVWLSLSGTLTSKVAATSQSCAVPLPPYAKTASCTVATFVEDGAIEFEDVSATGSTKRLNLTIPNRTIHGFWQAITETQPITLPAFGRTSLFRGR